MSTDNRSFKKLRISLTDTCNMACTYCVPDGDAGGIRAQLKPRLEVSEMIDLLAKLHKELGLKKVRITGGEPLLFPGIVKLVAEIKHLGIDDIAITTNAFYLSNLAPRLKEAGLKSINVSLDALDTEVFKAITRKDMLQQCLLGIDEAIKQGIKLKINSVIIKGVNENQILPLIAFGIQKQVKVRFLELMKMGYLHNNYLQHFVSQNEIIEIIKGAYVIEKQLRVPSATANYWKLEEEDYAFGIIANESEPFCKDCDRLRLDSYGKIYGCISATKGIDIKGKHDLKPLLTEAIQQKQRFKFIGNQMSMQFIGG
ncbi:GTP 3',8-cyclase MoaA [Saccharicrinis aurantiacus]|uniref:GTP 3',8-cyclase MoaA n=1 Tax=Saccharicrinis aurantiacus TaxID=1849719 RepID=UPI00249284F9|nr:GTP 3',8-cyclase MoaA [Saccharicrinis aurantiacus]